MKKIISTIFIVLMSCAVFANGLQDSTNGNKGDLPPVTIKTGSLVTEYTAIPKRVVVAGYPAVTVMCALNLDKHIIGIVPFSSSPKDALPEYQKQIKALPILPGLNKGFPTQESFLAKNPDLIYAPEAHFLGKDMGEIGDYQNFGINIYFNNSCTGKYGNPKMTLETTYKNIEDIGKIFRIEDKAKNLTKDLKDRVAKVEEKSKKRKKVKAYIHAYGVEKAITSGKKSIEDSIFELINVENIFSDVEKVRAVVSWEEIIKRNPDVIIIHTFSRQSGKDIINLFKSKKEFSEISAVKNNMFIEIPKSYTYPAIENVNYIEKVSEFLEKNGF